MYPAAQVKQVLDPAMLVLPAAQSEHVTVPGPVAYLPAGQLLHVDPPGVPRYVPIGQLWQVDVPSADA